MTADPVLVAMGELGLRCSKAEALNAELLLLLKEVAWLAPGDQISSSWLERVKAAVKKAEALTNPTTSV